MFYGQHKSQLIIYCSNFNQMSKNILIYEISFIIISIKIPLFSAANTYKGSIYHLKRKDYVE